MEGVFIYFCGMKDFLIVGLGLSGASLAFRLEEAGRDFLVFDDSSQKASRVAGGFMNPVILKRFTLAWKADEQLREALSFYREMEEDLKKTFLIPLEIYRRFHSAEEQNDWFAAADKPALEPFLDTKLVSRVNSYISGEHGFGRVVGAYRLDPKQLLETYTAHLQKEKRLIRERFVYEDLTFTDDAIEYRGTPFKKVIFCEGFGLLKNPFFNYLPLKGNKGEYIIIKSPNLKLEVVVKASVFIFPVGDDHYAVGATYNNSDSSPGPTENAREELVAKLKNILTTDFEVVDQMSGIRPTTVDRRPLAGMHPEHKRLYSCNGFGSRGILMAPWLSKELLEFIEDDKPLAPEVDLRRFTSKWYPKK